MVALKIPAFRNTKNVEWDATEFLRIKNFIFDEKVPNFKTIKQRYPVTFNFKEDEKKLLHLVIDHFICSCFLL